MKNVSNEPFYFPCDGLSYTCAPVVVSQILPLIQQYRVMTYFSLFDEAMGAKDHENARLKIDLLCLLKIVKSFLVFTKFILRL